jgi:hypothetical protein
LLMIYVRLHGYAVVISNTMFATVLLV